MKLSLRIKLTISYVLISLFLVFSLLFTARYMLNNQFEHYIRSNQEKNSREIANQVISAFGDNGTPPNQGVLIGIGEAALSKGFILKVVNTEHDILMCMDCLDQKLCGDMLMGMEHNMASIYPNFNGEYTEQIYDIQKGGMSYGRVTLGYYGPFYYSASDLQFLTVLNQIFLFGGIFALAVAVVLGFFMANRIARPIKKVIEQTGRIEHGNYKDLIAFSSNTTEVAHLVGSINSLASTLDRQQLLRKKLAQDYAHELRTPLASLQSNLEAMIDGIWEPNQARLESCNEEILRLTRMLSGIDRLVELEDYSLVLNKSAFDLLEFTRKLLMSFDSTLAEKNLTLTVDGNPCIIYADKDKLGQVIVNLVSNAIKYTENNGKIFISIVQNPHEVSFSIRDTGLGISEDDLPFIFEHLYRADKSRASATGGSGVGLAVVKAIIDAHSGRIEVQSELTKGSYFTITLPNQS